MKFSDAFQQLAKGIFIAIVKISELDLILSRCILHILKHNGKSILQDVERKNEQVALFLLFADIKFTFAFW